MSNNSRTQSGVNLWTNQSERAQGVLDYLLVEDDPEIQAERSKLVEVGEARRAEKILDADTGRSQSRVLFVTTQVAVLEKNSAAQQDYLDLADQFDEVHVLVLRVGVKEVSVVRADQNVWIYNAAAASWWGQVGRAYFIARLHLRFNGGVRPDIIVAKDPYLSTLAAYVIGRKFKRSVQVHITDERYPEKCYRQGLRGIFFRFALRRAQAIAVVSETILKFVTPQVGSTIEISILPVFQNFSKFKTSTPQFNLSEKYPQYKFFILAGGTLRADSHLHDAFSALHTVLHNPRIALIVIADGPAKELFVEKAKVLGVETSVVFVSEQTADLISYYRGADVLVETGVNPASETRIFQATMARLPIIAYETPLRKDLLPDGEAAYLTGAGDTVALRQKVNLFLNQTAIRKQFSRRLDYIATSRLHEDPVSHKRAMRDTIETTLLADFEEIESSESDSPELSADSTKDVV